VSPDADVDPLLCAAYREEADLYREALAAVEGLPAALQGGGNTQARLQKMLGLLQQIGTIEKRLVPVKARCRGKAWKRSAELVEVIAQIEKMIGRLMTGIQEAQQIARRRKSELEPELDALIRGSQMQRAYGSWR
jgi:hypothetical protein